MALNFPNDPEDQAVWEDTCGNVWIYQEATNSWAKPVDDSDIQLSPFVRNTAGEIKPRTEGDDLIMYPGLTDISQYPDA